MDPNRRSFLKTAGRTAVGVGWGLPFLSACSASRHMPISSNTAPPASGRNSMSTGCWLAHGTETAPGVVEYFGTAEDILTPGGRMMRMTTTDNGDGSYTMRMYDRREGVDEFQSMELRYSRN